MRTTFVHTGKAIVEQLAKTPMKSLEEYIGKLLMHMDMGSDSDPLSMLEVGYMKVIDFRLQYFDNLLLHKVSEDTYIVVMQETHHSTRALNVRVVAFKFTEDMLPLFIDAINEYTDSKQQIKESDSLTLDTILAYYVHLIVDSLAFLGLAKAHEPYTDMEKKHWHLKDKVYLIDYTNERT